MAVTRIKNNQITDSTIVANTKIQNYTVTSTLLANNLTYGSDLTVTGNLTVQGQTTTIDTNVTTIEDPVILLASTQTGSPTVDIGFIGERGTSDNIAFVWDESADEFVTAFTSTSETNTTITISSYASFKTLDAAVTGNLAVTGTTGLTGQITLTGNTSAGNFSVDASKTVTFGDNALGNVGTPTLATDAATKGYVDGQIGSIDFSISDGATTEIVLPGDTITFSGTSDEITVVVSATDTVTFGLPNNVIVSGSITGNSISSNTTITSTGNITGGNLLTGGLINATGNVTGGNVNTAGQVVATGNITGGNISTGGQINSTGNINGTGAVFSGNVTASTFIGNISGNIDAGGANTNIQFNDGDILNGSAAFTFDKTSNAVVASGNITGGNLITAGLASVTGNITGGNLITAGLASVTGNITGGNVTTTGKANIGTLEVTGTGTVTGNLSGGNISTAGQVTATGNVTGGNLNTGGKVVATGNLETGANLVASGYASVTGNVTGGNLLTGGLINATGNITGGNVTTTGKANIGTLEVTGTGTVTGNLSGGNISTAGQVTATGNVTGGNLVTVGLTNTGTLQVAGNAVVDGNLTVNGNLSYINIDDLRVQDPIIILGTGPNGAPLTTNDGLDRGVFMEYYTTGLGNAFMGWDNSTGNMVIAADAYFTANDVVGVNSYGTLQAGNLYIQSTVSTGNITGGNLLTGGLINATGNITGGNLVTSGTLQTTSIDATGNVTGGNINTGGKVVATGNVETGANLVASGYAAITGNVTGGNLITAGLASVTGNVTGGNLVTAGQVTATANITGGNLVTAGQVAATGNVTGGNIITTGNVNGNQGYFTGNVTVVGTFTSTSNIVANVSGIFYGNTVTGNGAIYAGLPSFTPLGSNVVAQFSGNVNSYSQINFQNISNGNVASTDYIATADNGDDSNNYIDLGINSSTFNDPVDYPGFYPNDAYVHNHGGNLILNPETAGKTIKLMVGGTDTTNVVATVSNTGIAVTGTVSATGNTSGGNLTTAGQVTATGNVSGGNVTTAGQVVATGNVNGGNLVTAGLTTTSTLAVSSTSTFTGNVTSAFNVTGNIAGGNLSTPGLISATGNVSGGNLNTAGQVVATGNVNGGNVVATALVTGANVSATSNVSGANVVGTTAGVFGNIVISGDNITDTNGRVNFNTAGADVDFAVNGDTVANVFYVDAGTGTASFGSATQTTNALVAFNTTSSILVPVGNIGTRPSTGVTGMLRFNTTNNNMEVFDNSQWSAIGVPSFTVIVNDSFAGDGTTVAFTLSESASTDSCIVSINGVVQIPTTAYSVSGTTLTFTEAPLTGDAIDVRILTTTTTVTSISNASGNAVVATLDTAATVQITGDLLPASNLTANLGSPTKYWKSLYVGGNTIYLGNLQLKEASANTFAVYTSDGTTQANIDVGNVDVGSITQGTTAIGISGTNGNAYITVAGTSNVFVASATGANVTGTLGVTGNITGGNLSGTSIVGTLTTAAQTNITSVGTLGSLAVTGNTTSGNFVGTLNGSGANVTSISATNISSGTLAQARLANASIIIGNTTATLGATVTTITGLTSVTSTTFVGALTGAATTAGTVTTAAQPNITSVGTLSSLTVTANVTGGNLITGGLISATGAITGGALTGTSLTVGTGNISGGNIVNTNANGVGNIGSSTTYFNTVFAKATSAQYADLAEKYVADAEYPAGTVVIFGGDKEVTVTSVDADRAVAGVVSTNPSYIMNGGLEAEFVATVALTGRVPCRVTGTVRKGDLMVSAGYGLARAEQDPRVGTVIGKALENFEGNEGVIEVVVGRF